MGGVWAARPCWLVGALESVAQESNLRLDVEVSRYPPVPHFLHLEQKNETLDPMTDRDELRFHGNWGKRCSTVMFFHALDKIRFTGKQEVANKLSPSAFKLVWLVWGGTNLQDPDQMGCTGQWLDLQGTSRTKRRERKNLQHLIQSQCQETKQRNGSRLGWSLISDWLSFF